MCLAIPSKVIEKKDQTATVDVRGARLDVNLMLLPEEAAVGDYVLVHAGFAIQKIDAEAARETLALIDQMIEASRDPQAPGA